MTNRKIYRKTILEKIVFFFCVIIIETTFPLDTFIRISYIRFRFKKKNEMLS